MLAGLKPGDGGLAHPEPPSKLRLAQLVLGPVGDQQVAT
jgi:hypothetical protein